MVYFLIGPSKSNKNIDSTKSQINASIGNNGDTTGLNLKLNKYFFL